MSQSIRTRSIPTYVKNLLWIDCTGGALVGVLTILLSGWLSRLEGLPQEVLLFIGGANLLYASYSFSLAVQAERPMRLIKLLVVANLAWVPVCLGILAVFSATATPFAFVEWRWRHQLLTEA